MLRALDKVMLSLSLLVTLSSCVQTMRAIEHSKLDVSLTMSAPLFLDPVMLERNPNVYVKTRNTSDMQEIAFEQLLMDGLKGKGYTIVPSAAEADHVVQAHVLYMGHEKKGLTAEGMLAGGFGGALAGGLLGGTAADRIGLGAAGAIGGGLLGAAVGAAFKVESYVGVVDVQVKSRVNGGVMGKETAVAPHGTSTTVVTEREFRSEHQEYRTRIVARATQTNIDRGQAAQVISERLALQISNLF